MADRFYVKSPLSPGPVEVRGPEAHHLGTVCRVRPGDLVCLFNGDGREYPATVRSVARQSVALEVLAALEPARETGFRLEVAAPLPRGDREQFLVEKLTELGVTTFVPLKTARSVVHPREAKAERLERYVVEASKQCRRNVLMRVEPMTPFEDYCRRPSLPARRLLAHPGGERAEAGGDVAVAVGPEGGFTDAEVEAARQAGWRLVGLGPRVLRVETAALVLAAWLGGMGSGA
jgi:16S rRNA (uracil1498-N3)-methyltransferase